MSTFQKIGDRIENLKGFLGKTIAELEKGRPEDYPGKEDRLLGNATISGWLGKDLSWTSDTLEKFLRYWNVNPTWWKTGEGPILLTPVKELNGSKENGKAMKETFYKELIEDNQEYSIVPKTILNGEYRIVLISEVEASNKKWQDIVDSKNDLITELKELNKELKARVEQVALVKQTK